jgi:hypothetical protein
MKPAVDDLEHRRPVWLALSDLFLDTELQPDHLAHIARILARSPYSLPELESILYDEVYPVCIVNLQTVAGEWDGFDEEWLEESILKKLQATRPWTRWFQVSRWMIRANWNRVKVLLSGEAEAGRM